MNPQKGTWFSTILCNLCQMWMAFVVCWMLLLIASRGLNGGALLL
jgi:hypothetical protein